RETTKDISFCAHTIHGEDLMEVEDTLKDERFSGNPLVLEGPKIRFYAGVPLIAPRGGHKLGTLCVLDREPRTLTKQQQFALEVLAKYIVQLLELRIKKKNLVLAQRDHRSLQEKMRRQERTLARIQRAARIGMFEFDIAEDSLKISEGFCDLFGIKLTGQINKTQYLELVHPDDLPGFKNYLNSLQKGTARRFTYDYRCNKKRKGQHIHIRTIGEVVRNEKAEPMQLIGIKQDITRQKWYEQQLEEQNAELMKVNEELDNFVYRVSHDLRAPIASLLGLAEIIDGEEDINKVHELLLLVKKTLDKQDKFIKDILDYSRNSRQEIQAEIIDFHELLEDIFSEYAFVPQYKQVEFGYIVVQDVFFMTDLYRLRVILNNLISNAFKYLQYHKENAFVKVKVNADAAKAIIEVADNGTGIPANHLPRIFEMFYRATDQQPGSGLGLYIVKETISKLKGEVSIESQQGEGSVFRVSLPNLARE
ncbi:MAG: PAS domain-containing protein, partial [Bacteroidetes bacterium]|nr:PAS domain-containing protein [Bacteroidota bacterium]